VESLDDAMRARERLMLGLRLDEPLPLDRDIEPVVDASVLERLEEQSLVARSVDSSSGVDRIALTRRGRFLGGAVTSELLRWPDDDDDEPEPRTAAVAGARRPVG
jgi:coproporphyrinogen III oxidase-like Fe-S oxidoreductase